MMTISELHEKVKKWLSGGANPVEGLALLGAIGCAPDAIRELAQDPETNAERIRLYLCHKAKIDASTAPRYAKERQKTFRQEFPFLNEPGCPMELEVLATRKISKYHAYVDAHARMRFAGSLEEMAQQAGEVIDSYLENRAIYDELHYFAEHHAVLGRHPIFNEMKRRQQLNGMSIKDLVQRANLLKGYIYRIERKIAKGDAPHLIVQRKDQIRAYREELNDIDRLIG